MLQKFRREYSAKVIVGMTPGDEGVFGKLTEGNKPPVPGEIPIFIILTSIIIRN